jgi:L-glyceraldehyde 3-phosphate reductase
MTVAWLPSAARHAEMPYRRCGSSGLKLPAVSLGLWHNFGTDKPRTVGDALCRTAFDNGITHFDLANNYGPPPGEAERAFGEILRTTFGGLRDELIVATKAGYRMWPGPYGDGGSRKYLLASLDQSLKRMGLDYVDIFYSHRFDPDTPLEETMGALDSAVRQGKALYVGLSSYDAATTRGAMAILRALGTPCIVSQPSYSMLNRWIEQDRLLDVLDQEGLGSVAFSPLAQGLLTDKYLAGVPQGSRGAGGQSPRLNAALSDGGDIPRIQALAAIAARRGVSLAQLALAWVLRGGRVTSALIGASRPEQIIDCLAALKQPELSAEELAEIDLHAKDSAAGSNFNLTPPSVK